MNYKLLVFTYRTRYCTVKNALGRFNRKITRMLNVGCGEGDYDALLKKHCKELYSCDVNKEDIDYCKSANKNKDVHYSLKDITKLEYPSDFFDFVVCIDVLEHVSSVKKSLQNLKRVMKKDGYALVSFPQSNFPFTYDPINKIIGKFGKKINIGAYSFGHDRLIKDSNIEKLFKENGFRIVKKKRLSKYLVGFFEMYLAGFLQKLVKPNSSNKQKSNKKLNWRPDSKESKLLSITDFIIKIDEESFRNSKSSIGLFYVLQLKK